MQMRIQTHQKLQVEQIDAFLHI